MFELSLLYHRNEWNPEWGDKSGGKLGRNVKRGSGNRINSLRNSIKKKRFLIHCSRLPSTTSERMKRFQSSSFMAFSDESTIHHRCSQRNMTWGWMKWTSFLSKWLRQDDKIWFSCGRWTMHSLLNKKGSCKLVFLFGTLWALKLCLEFFILLIYHLFEAGERCNNDAWASDDELRMFDILRLFPAATQTEVSSRESHRRARAYSFTVQMTSFTVVPREISSALSN